jgi:hypothetical protein
VAPYPFCALARHRLTRSVETLVEDDRLFYSIRRFDAAAESEIIRGVILPRPAVRAAVLTALVTACTRQAPAPRAAATPAPSPTPRPLVRDHLAFTNAVDALAADALQRGPVAGLSIAVFERGLSVLAKGYGFADLAAKTPATPETSYPIASISKRFTAALILRLADQGKLALDDPLDRFFPEARKRIGALTIRHLLDHTSGLTKGGPAPRAAALNVLMREYIVASVRADHPLASANDLIARLKKDPASVSMGFATARGNQNHIVIGMLARAAGVDPKALKTVVFASGAQGLTAVLGGHVDMLVGTPGTALPQFESGKVRILGISSATRQPGKQAALPTFREQGIDAVYYAWRGFLAPRGITPAQIAFWEQAFAKIAQGENWKKDLEDNAWAEDLRGAAETRKHLEAEHELLSRMLVDLGVIAR